MPGPIEAALANPGGARFHKCALQVNPFAYLAANGRTSTYMDEQSYNRALVDALVAQEVQVIAVTDHYRVKTGLNLWNAAREAGIVVLPGFEAVSKEGVHFLCLFDATKGSDDLERAIGACGVHRDSGPSPVGDLDAGALLDKGKGWGAVFVAAHVASPGGLLKMLHGTARANAWKSAHLLACSLPGPASQAPADLRDILANSDKTYKRRRPMAVINAQDVSDPADLEKPGSCTWIKMSECTTEGLRQAFLDPDSRIRLASDPVPDQHTEFLAIAWEGGFLDGVGLRLNENLNALIGGRGSGKSTVIESIRYVLGLQPLGPDATKAHNGIVRGVLKDGTKISLLIRSYTPSAQEYLVERTVPNLPIVRNAQGALVAISPLDLVPRAEVYGQHEIGELARSPDKLTRLLARFLPQDPEASQRKSELTAALASSRTAIVEQARKLEDARARIARLPALQEQLRRYKEAGIEEKLKDHSVLVTEERVFTTTEERLKSFRVAPTSIRKDLPIDRAFLSEMKLAELPGQAILSELNPILVRVDKELQAAAVSIESALASADADIAAVKKKWDLRKATVEEVYAAVLRALQTTKVDTAEFLRLRKDIEGLIPVQEQLPKLESELATLVARRRTMLVKWEDLKTSEFRALDQAAARVSKQLAGRVRVSVRYAGDRQPLFDFLREKIAGRLSEAVESLQKDSNFSLGNLADAWKQGPDELVRRYGMPQGQAEHLTKAPVDVLLELEELELSSTSDVELNLSNDPGHPAWNRLDDLSTGQKATAVLLLLLLESDAPLAVDQPEDDLDNRFITEGVVPKMKEEKRRRQFIFATHNANIPVLGDAELIVGLEAFGEAGRGRGRVTKEHMGSIDCAPVRGMTEELLEGGELAFETRRLKYGF